MTSPKVTIFGGKGILISKMIRVLTRTGFSKKKSYTNELIETLGVYLVWSKKESLVIEHENEFGY